MNIINEDRIHKKYFKDIEDQFNRKVEDIKEIVIHGTGGGKSARAILNWMLAGERAEQYKKGIALFHSEIDKNGDIYNILNPLYWCYHSSSGKHDKYTIGIELVNSEVDNKGSYTSNQYKSLFEMIDAYLGLFPIASIVGHGYNGKKFSGKYKNCPGNFDWNKLQKFLIAEGFKFNKADNECYELER
ncbi:MAG: N-acetylmuramoyl-L-alanine amidase [Spirochaetes bacterium]|nr:N-acetylmuramoyl-L-alanine amidase [Spirochaetota bacterium]